MSIKDAKTFLDKLKTDKAFSDEVMKASQQVIELAKKTHKLDFTRQELRTVLKEHWSKPDDDADACVKPFSQAPGF